MTRFYRFVQFDGNIINVYFLCTPDLDSVANNLTHLSTWWLGTHSWYFNLKYVCIFLKQVFFSPKDSSYTKYNKQALPVFV